MHARQLALVTGLALALGVASGAPGATIGQWNFDSLVDTTPPQGDPPENPPGGEVLEDSSGNNRHFVSALNGGTVSLTNDRPSVMPAGTTALDSNSGGAKLFSTPSTTAFHVGNTGQMTVEFWYKYVSGSSFPYVLSFNGGNGGAFSGDWGFYNNAGASTLNYFAYPNTGFPEGSFGVSDGGWHHIAGTVIANDALRVYVDGALVNTVAVGAYPVAAADVLKFARDTADGQSNAHFLIDELRISDVALLPGSGTGVGELAWNSSLVPEPASMAAAMIGALAIARRRRAR